MLAFAAFTPHPLMAIPDIGRNHVSKIRSTMKAFRELADELYAAKVDTIICISPHALAVEGAITINQRPELAIAFRSFGNLSDTVALMNDVGFGYAIKESIETTLPSVLIESEELDYGASIPLFHLIRGYVANQIRCVPIGTCDSLTLQQHYDLGTAINRKIHTTTKRIAVIASGDLSHGASKYAPGGLIASAAAFNTVLQNLFVQHNLNAVISLPLEKYPGITACALRPLALLAGILDERKYQTQVLSFETPLGVGYLTAQIHES
jgi:aromatic ring-opening dioxygenase LigB subunit